MKEITNYFRNAIAASSQRTIEYKEDNFFTISFDEIEKGIIGKKAVLFLWKSEEIRDEDIEKENIKIKHIMIALKTLATEFMDNTRTESNIEEMTSVFFLPASVSIDGRLLLPEEGKVPWIPREYLSPMEEPQIALGKMDRYDEYLEKTTDTRNQIDSWDKYLAYAIDMYEYVAEVNFEEQYLKSGNERIKVDGKYYLFEDSLVSASFHILQMYNHLLKDGGNKLYHKLMNGKTEPSRQLIKITDIEKMKLHVGQMGGSFPLSESQREALNHFSEIQEGDVLAVSGPPGTGKTTFLQSIVANMYVEAALKKKNAPIIVAASTNNQAVTNIIDSFGKVEPIGVSNLERKWITATNSFATYFPSKGKMKEAAEKGYQYTTVNGGGIIDDLESNENRNAAKQLFIQECGKYFYKNDMELSICKNVLWQELDKVNDLRIDCLSLIERIKNILGNETYGGYVEKLKRRIQTKEAVRCEFRNRMDCLQKRNRQYLNRMLEWRNSYNKLPWYVRLLKFIPVFKNRILTWSFSFMVNEELAFLKRDMKIEEIERIYRQKINECDYEIVQLQEKKGDVHIEIKELKVKRNAIETLLNHLKMKFHFFDKYQIIESKKENDIWEQFDLCKLNDLLDRVRYVEFWLAVHYYESRWLIEKNPISDKQKGKTFENVLNEMYHRLAMISPCMVMTFFMLPKQFLAYNGNDKNHYYMYDYIDLLIVDEAGQTSPEIAVPSFALAKKAVVVGDEKQIPPVWGTSRALDISMAVSNGAIQRKEEYYKLEENGLNCSQSSIMKLAALSCAFDKFDKGLFLSEHRRCYNEIIAYCNKLVYNDKLEAKRGSFHENKDNALLGVLPAMGHVQVTVAKSKKKGGSRCNLEEAEQIVLWLGNNFDRIVECYKKGGKEEIDKKEVFGIITPFKSQSILIKKLIKRRLPGYAAFLGVGTVHTFQGAERKVILFSSVYGNEDGCYFINKAPHLMNVAVSRAKDAFLVFGDRGSLVGGENTAAGLLNKMLEKVE